MGDGATVTEAIEAVVEENADAMDDEEDRPDLILALALLASERATPPPWLVSEARQIIANGTALARGEGTIGYESRRAAEAALLAALDGTAPHPGRPGRLLPGHGP